MTTILHVASRVEWERAQAAGVYRPPELARDGFLHCCTEAQLPFVLDRHFKAATGLVVLQLDPAATDAPLEWVRSEADQDPFPHLRGAIPVSAVLFSRTVG